MTPAERVRTGCALHDFAHQRLVLHPTREHPELDRREILKLVCKRSLGDAADVL